MTQCPTTISYVDPTIIAYYNDLSMGYGNLFVVPSARIELATDPYQGPVRPLNYEGLFVVGDVRLELTRIAPLVPKTSASTVPPIAPCLCGVRAVPLRRGPRTFLHRREVRCKKPKNLV